MPRINAATIAEHREHQLRVLLDAARDLLLTGGYAALTFGALAQRAGLARPTIYSYFRTKDDVVVALCEVDLPVVGADINRAVAQAHNPRDRIAAFVRAQLRTAQESRYRLAHTLTLAPLSPDARQRIVALHREHMPSATPLFAELRHPRPALAAALLQGLITAAVTAMNVGESPTLVSRTCVAAALEGLTTRTP